MNYKWFKVGILGKPGKTIKIGIERRLYSNTWSILSSAYTRGIPNNLKFRGFFEKNKYFMDSNLNIYSVKEVSDGGKPLAHLILKSQCGNCKNGLIFVEGQIVCDKCNQVRATI